MPVPAIEPKELKKALDAGLPVILIDVRQPEEYEVVKIEGGVLVPLMELESRIDEVRKLSSDSNSLKVVYCRSGGRSAHAIEFLSSVGLEGFLNLRGGINAYALEADSTLKPY